MELARIRLLPEVIVNRIAAGEVIERPAAAVKELVENALDAGAQRISVRLVDGGISLIEVVDDGHGMGPEDLALAVQRHATSKLTDETLVRIDTLGFRGEALPSIGAAARLRLTSRVAGASTAYSIAVAGGEVGAVQPAAGAVGTTVSVADLFYATPARRKFLKTPRLEAEHVEAALRRLAMAAPMVAFRLQNESRVVFDMPAQDADRRAGGLLGVDAAAALVAVSLEREGMALSGFACRPSVSRATGASQLLAVNGRPVTDPQLKTAVRVAYRDVMAHGRHAIVALSLLLPPEALDVNVHPAKSELRFRDAAAVRGLVISGLSRALAAPLTGVAGEPARLSANPYSGRRPALHLVPPRAPAAMAAQRDLAPLPQHYRRGPFGLAEPAPRFAENGADAGAESSVASPTSGADREASQLLGVAVAQLFETYVIAVANDGSLVLVDQHAAHERLTQEALQAQLMAPKNGQEGVRSQALLLPAVVDLPSSDAARLLAHRAALARLGVELEGFGAGAVLVRALPALLGAPDPAPLLRDIAEELAEHGESTALEARLDAVIARMACHGSIRAGRRLNPAEMNALLRQIEASPRAATCSHGRPTYLTFTRADLERLFGRR